MVFLTTVFLGAHHLTFGSIPWAQQDLKISYKLKFENNHLPIYNNLTTVSLFHTVFLTTVLLGAHHFTFGSIPWAQHFR